MTGSGELPSGIATQIPVAKFQKQSIVSFDVSEGRLVCDCGYEGEGLCKHIAYVELERSVNGGTISLLPATGDVSHDEMERLVNNPEELRAFMIEHLPVVCEDHPTLEASIRGWASQG